MNIALYDEPDWMLCITTSPAEMGEHVRGTLVEELYEHKVCGYIAGLQLSDLNSIP